MQLIGQWKRIAAAIVLAAIPAWAEEIRVTQDEALKAAVSKATPEYSTMARQLKIEGEVKVDILIDEEGAIEKIGGTTGNPMLVQCAKDALKRWKFTPFKAEGKPAKAAATLSFKFKL